MFTRFSVPSGIDSASVIALEPRGEATQPLLRQAASEGWLDASGLEAGDARSLHTADQLDTQMMLHRSMMRAKRTADSASLKHAVLRHADRARVRTAEFCVKNSVRMAEQTRDFAGRCSTPSFETVHRGLACLWGASMLTLVGLLIFVATNSSSSDSAGAEAGGDQDATQDVLGLGGTGAMLTPGGLGLRTASELAAAAVSRAAASR